MIHEKKKLQDLLANCIQIQAVICVPPLWQILKLASIFYLNSSSTPLKYDLVEFYIIQIFLESHMVECSMGSFIHSWVYIYPWCLFSFHRFPWQKAWGLCSPASCACTYRAYGWEERFDTCEITRCCEGWRQSAHLSGCSLWMYRRMAGTLA